MVLRAERTCAEFDNVRLVLAIIRLSTRSESVSDRDTVLLQVKVETKVEKGDPRDVICETVGKIGADVLVLGSHGYGLIKRRALVTTLRTTIYGK